MMSKRSRCEHKKREVQQRTSLSRFLGDDVNKRDAKDRDLY